MNLVDHLPTPVARLLSYPLKLTGLQNPKPENRWVSVFVRTVFQTALAYKAVFVLFPQIPAGALALATLGGLLLSSKITLLAAGGLAAKTGAVALRAAWVAKDILAGANGAAFILLGIVLWNNYDRNVVSFGQIVDKWFIELISPFFSRILPSPN